jgi:hypothetical protein
MSHPTLKAVVDPLLELRKVLRAKALMRLKYENKDSAPELKNPDSKWYNNPEGYAEVCRRDGTGSAFHVSQWHVLGVSRVSATRVMLCRVAITSPAARCCVTPTTCGVACLPPGPLRVLPVLQVPKAVLRRRARVWRGRRRVRPDGAGVRRLLTVVR